MFNNNPNNSNPFQNQTQGTSFTQNQSYSSIIQPPLVPFKITEPPLVALFKIIKRAGPTIIPSLVKIQLILKLLIILIPSRIKDKLNNRLIHSAKVKLKVVLSLKDKLNRLVLLVKVKVINYLIIKQTKDKTINYSAIKEQEGINHIAKEIPTIKLQLVLQFHLQSMMHQHLVINQNQ